MAYRNKTYVAFASENIKSYYLMKAWNENEHIDFNFFDAHDLNTARDSSLDETIKGKLRERLSSSKQAIVLGSADARRKGGDSNTFLGYEIKTLLGLDIPIIIANLDGLRTAAEKNIPSPLYSDRLYSMSVSFQPKIIKHALDDYAERFAGSDKKGCYYYNATVYENLGM